MPVDDPLVVAFGSCRKQHRPQPVWEAVSRLRPSVWLWTGDYVYGGKHPLEPEELREHYKTAGKSEHLLRKSQAIIDGVYDDHDYGVNDGGKHWRHRDAARQLFLDHVTESPSDSARRTQAGGMYGSRTFGRAPHAVKVVMLDTRYARDDYIIPSVGGLPFPKAGYAAGMVRALSALFGIGSGHDGDILGTEEQWRWLEAELSNSTAAAHLIVSSVQVLTTSPAVESWGHFPASRRRLLELLRRVRPQGALLISGDVHFAEMMGAATQAAATPTVTMPAVQAASDRLDVIGGSSETVVEVTSSGLTHSCADGRVSRLLCSLSLRLFSGHRLDARGLAVVGAAYPHVNFGSLAFSWPSPSNRDGSRPEAEASGHVDIRIHGVDGHVHLQKRLPLGLSADAEAARWQLALELPTIFESAGHLRAPIAAVAISGLVAAFRCVRRRPAATRRATGTAQSRVASEKQASHKRAAADARTANGPRAAHRRLSKID
jgi:hypothetical protein